MTDALEEVKHDTWRKKRRACGEGGDSPTPASTRYADQRGAGPLPGREEDAIVIVRRLAFLLYSVTEDENSTARRSETCLRKRRLAIDLVREDCIKSEISTNWRYWTEGLGTLPRMHDVWA